MSNGFGGSGGSKETSVKRFGQIVLVKQDDTSSVKEVYWGPTPYPYLHRLAIASVA